MKFEKKEILLKTVLTRHLSFGHSHPSVYATTVKGNRIRAKPRDLVWALKGSTLAPAISHHHPN